MEYSSYVAMVMHADQLGKRLMDKICCSYAKLPLNVDDFTQRPISKWDDPF